jgi:hypothetical protein
MNAVSSASALLATIVAGLALMFVLSGNESVYFDWTPMEGDLSLYQLAQMRNPEVVEPMTVAENEEPHRNARPRPRKHAAQPSEMAESGTTAMATDTTAPAPTPSAPAETGGPRNRVLWISIASFRGDYMEKAQAPFLKEMAGQGQSSSSLLPVFPTLHYPCLMSQATGMPVTGHGISGNRMRDPETKEILDRPTKLSLLGAEPIWTLAKRQGLAVLVHDWPFSQEQPTSAPADVFLPKFDPELSDEARLNALLEAWGSFKGPKKIALAMASLHDLEKAAISHGSRDPATFEAVAKMDTVLKNFFEKLRGEWPSLSSPGDKLYVVLTTDHGRADAEKVINFAHLMGPLAERVDYTVDSGVANIWFKEPPAGVKMEAFTKKYDEELRARIYWKSFPRGEYPSYLNLGAGGPFLGDRLLILKGGYAFADAKGSEPVYNPSETSGPFSFGGYPVHDSSRMKGQVFLFELNGHGKTGDLGEIEGAQFYPTVCEILELKGTSAVTAKPLSVN